MPAQVRTLLGSYVVLSVVYALGIQLYGPFLRSMVACSAALPSGGAFTGSAYCGDTHRVLAVAQAQEGRLVGMKLMVHGFSGPFLAVLADRMGRRPVLLLGMGGFAMAFGLFAVAASVATSALQGEGHDGGFAASLVALCFFVEGSSSAFDVTYLSMLADMTPSPAERTAAFSAYYLVGALGQAAAELLAVKILRLSLASYTGVWICFCFALVGNFVLVAYSVRESLHPSSGGTARSQLRRYSLWALVPDAKAAAKELRGPVEMVIVDRFLRLWLLSMSLISLTSGLWSTQASFTLAVYGWRPGDLQACMWPSRILQLGSLGFLGPMVGRCRARPVVVGVTIAACVLTLAEILAPFTPIALVGPHLVHSALGFGRPVITAFLSSHFAAGQQAKVQAVTHLFTNIATSISIPLFSGPLLFRPEARGWAAARPFLLGSAFFCAGGGIRVALVCAAEMPRPRVGVPSEKELDV